MVSARDMIVRKFTNYRNHMKRIQKTDSASADDLIESMKRAASALVDLKSYSKGKALFKKKTHTKIAVLRDSLLRNNPNLSRLGAYQKALKQKWSEADHEYWEVKAIGEAEDIYE